MVSYSACVAVTELLRVRPVLTDRRSSYIRLGYGPRQIYRMSILIQVVVVSVMIVRLTLAVHNRPHTLRLRIYLPLLTRHNKPSNSNSNSSNNNHIRPVHRPHKIRIISRISWRIARPLRPRRRQQLRLNTFVPNTPILCPPHSHSERQRDLPLRVLWSRLPRAKSSALHFRLPSFGRRITTVRPPIQSPPPALQLLPIWHLAL